MKSRKIDLFKSICNEKFHFKMTLPFFPRRAGKYRVRNPGLGNLSVKRGDILKNKW